MALPRLLVVSHSKTGGTTRMLEAVLAGAEDPEISGVEIVSLDALEAGPDDARRADAIVLGTPENFGYMSGALKHFFDLIYYPCLESTKKLPYAAWVHGDDDTGGAIAAIEKITTGLQWRTVQPPLSLTGKPQRADLDAAWELGAAVAALLAG